MKNRLKLLIIFFIAGWVALFPSCQGEKKDPKKKSPSLSEKFIKEKKNKIDGAMMILIPGGEYIIGGPPGGEKPAKVNIKPFYIYKFEVTNSRFEAFVNRSRYTPEGECKLFTNEKTKNHPVIEVSYSDGKAYAKWAGGSLPTGIQWEAAACGKKGLLFPWGNRWDPEKCNNRGMTHLRKKVAKIVKEQEVWYGTLPVGSFPGGASPFGVMDMAGNVSEWCRDWYKGDGTLETEERVLRGGSFYDGEEQMRCPMIDGDDPEKWCNLYGFRVVIPVEK